MKKLLWMLLLVSGVATAQVQPYPPTAVTVPIPLTSLATQNAGTILMRLAGTGTGTPGASPSSLPYFVDLTQYGVKCDGSTDDTAAINSALVSARTAASGSNPVLVWFPPNTAAAGCVISGTGINDTMFRPGNGVRSVIEGNGAVLYCVATAKCWDQTGTHEQTVKDLQINAGNSSGPTIGWQVARPNSTTDCTQNTYVDVSVYGNYSFAAWYDMQCEQNSWIEPSIANTQSSGHVLVMDGQNHFNATSSFQTITQPTDTDSSFTLNYFLNATLTGASASTDILWMASTHAIQFVQTYIHQPSPTNPPITLYDSNIANDGNNLGLDLDIHVENAPANIFLLTGANTTPTVRSLHYRDQYMEATSSVFKRDTGVTSATLLNMWIEVQEAQVTPTMFDTASAFTCSGRVYVPNSTLWGACGTWNGTADVLGTLTTTVGTLTVNGATSVPVTITAPSNAYQALLHFYQGASQFWQVGQSSGSNPPYIIYDQQGNKTDLQFNSNGSGTLMAGGGPLQIGEPGSTITIAGNLCLLGSSTGCTTLASANAGATNYTLTFPAITDTVATLTATQTLTNKTLTAPALQGPIPVTSGTSYTGSAWTTAGIGLSVAAATFNDSSSTGTVTTEAANAIAAQTTSATNTITITNLDNLYLAAPVAGTHVTATNLYALDTPGNVNIGGNITTGGQILSAVGSTGAPGYAFSAATNTGFDGNSTTLNFIVSGAIRGSFASTGIFTAAGGVTMSGTLNLNASNNAVTNIGTGTTSSAVNIGGGSNNIVLGSNHSYSGTAPTVSACGTSSIDSHATSSSGTVTPGTATSCTITFATAFATWNHCNITSETALAAFAYSYTLSAITVTASALAGGKIDYRCDGV